MDVNTLQKNAVKITALFLVITSVLTVTICQDEILQLYANEDDEYDRDYDPFVGDDEKNVFNIPSRAQAAPEMTANINTRQTIKCDENQLLTYLAQLQVTNPESLLLIASYKDLEHLCRRIAGTLDSIDSFMQSCIPLSQDHLYMQLIAGLRILSARLCMECDYEKSYRNHLSCFHELHAEYTDCAGPADWTENMDHNELCNEYRIISDCYFTKTAMLCGIKAAKTMKELVVRVINGIIDTHCPELRNNPAVPNAMPESLVSSAFVPQCFLHNLNLILIIFTDVTRLLVL